MARSIDLHDEIKIIESNISEINEIVLCHIDSLAYPMDSWLEDRLTEAMMYKIEFEEKCIGYIGIIDDTIQFFYVCQEYFKYAPTILENFVKENTITKIFILTHDSLLSRLIAEWEYEKEMLACWFVANGKTEVYDGKNRNWVFRVALQSDSKEIREVSGDFFDEVSGGFNSLEERIGADTIFVLEENNNLLGCGIVEKGQFSKGVASIGMYVSKIHRKKGAAREILLNLKEWAYINGFEPVAGCWYYNTLSRMSLESAGMIVASIGFVAILKGKEVLPLRTGNPPGELVTND